jgi:hypothetical protein
MEHQDTSCGGCTVRLPMQVPVGVREFEEAREVPSQGLAAATLLCR